MKLHQFVHTLAYGDAISGEAITIQRILRAAGLSSEIYVVNRDTRLKRFCKNYSEFTSEPGSAVLLHYSIASPLNDLFIKSNEVKRAVLYHNLTPESWFFSYNARVVADLKKARSGLKEVVEYADLVLGDSKFNLSELKEFRIKDARPFPLTLDLSKWDIQANAGIANALKGHGGVNILSVGRVAPNKCLEDVIKCFYFYHHKINRESRLWLVGSDTDTEIYSFELRDLIEHLQLREAVKLVGPVADTELKAFYENSDLYMCMSEHEGFCVPLIEAMHFELPIIAYDSCAIGETLGKSGILIQRKEHAKIAEVMNIVLNDSAMREKLFNESRDQLSKFSLDAFQEQLIRDLVEPLSTPCFAPQSFPLNKGIVSGTFE